MQPAEEQRNAGSPLLATLLGCLGLLVVPALLLAALLFCAYQYIEQAAESPADTPGATSQLPGDAELGPPFTGREDLAIRKHFQALGATDKTVRDQAWKELFRYHEKNAPRLREKMAAELERSENPQFISAATWGLTFYYGEPGRASVVRTAVKRKEHPAVLTGIASGVATLKEEEGRAEMRRRIHKALTEARSPFADRFEP